MHLKRSRLVHKVCLKLKMKGRKKVSKEVEVNQNKRFPWGAAAVFMAASIVMGINAVNTAGSILDLESNMMAMAGVFGIVATLIGAIIEVVIEYVLTKFPTQWISKENNVYKYDIWSAIFYSNAISLALNLLIQQFSIQANLIVILLVKIVTTGLFLLFYFSGEKKKDNVKKAITVVQIGLLALSFILNIVVLNLF